MQNIYKVTTLIFRLSITVYLVTFMYELHVIGRCMYSGQYNPWKLGNIVFCIFVPPN